jgi:SIR2-like domain
MCWTFAASAKIEYGTGLKSDAFNPSRSYAFGFDVSGFHILKLHGSLNWTMQSSLETPVRKGLVPQSFVLQREIPPDYSNMVDAVPALLFGGAKLTARGPFLTLSSMLRATIRQARRLTVVGYSFRDDHVNETIVEFLNQQSWSRLTIIDPFPKRVPTFVQGLLKACPERVTLVRKCAGEGLREVFDQS